MTDEARDVGAAERERIRAAIASISPADLAELFHRTYERLAPDFGYKTREASAKPWADAPDQNKALMTAVSAHVMTIILAHV